MFFPGAVDPHTHIGGATKVVGSLAAAMKVCTRALAIGGRRRSWR